jgi:hypothetical protein
MKLNKDIEIMATSLLAHYGCDTVSALVNNTQFLDGLLSLDLDIDTSNVQDVRIFPRDSAFKTIQHEVTTAVVLRKLAMHLVKVSVALNTSVLSQLLSSQDILDCLVVRDKVMQLNGYNAGAEEILAEMGMSEYDEEEDEDDELDEFLSSKLKQTKTKETLH